MGESTVVFAFLFLQRLPREICVLLSEDDPVDMRAIAEMADRLIAMHLPQSHDSCVAMSTDEQLEDTDTLVSAQGARSCKGKGPKWSQQSQQNALGHCIDLSNQGKEQGPTLLTSMCYYHAKFGEQGKYCEEGCAWLEN